MKTEIYYNEVVEIFFVNNMWSSTSNKPFISKKKKKVREKAQDFRR